MHNILSNEAEISLRKLLKSYPNIISCYIFGSFVTGKQKIYSDLDLGILCFSKNNLSPLEIEVKISKLIKGMETDVSLLDSESDPLILMQIINGTLLFEKSTSERIKLETWILHAYEDYRNFRRINNYYLDKSFKEGIYAN